MEIIMEAAHSIPQYDGKVTINFQIHRNKSLFFRIELDKTVWRPFIGTVGSHSQSGILDKYLWDPITPIYNPLVTLINGICFYIFGKRPLSYHIDEASALQALAAINRDYNSRFVTGAPVNELGGLESIYCTSEGMANYMDSRPRSKGAAYRTLLRDAARPVATSLPPEVRQYLPYFPFPTTPTPWTGMVGIEKETGAFLGRVANGGGRKDGYSESGMIYAPNQRGNGLGKDATFALAIHAWLFTKLKHPVNGHPVTYFTATVSRDNPITSGLAKALQAEILETEFQPL